MLEVLFGVERVNMTRERQLSFLEVVKPVFIYMETAYSRRVSSHTEEVKPVFIYMEADCSRRVSSCVYYSLKK